MGMRDEKGAEAILRASGWVVGCKVLRLLPADGQMVGYRTPLFPALVWS